jgi:hypothetical protein
MIASDISRNRTVQLPFIETPSPLYVETAMLRRYFPPSVAEWMIERCGDYEERVAKQPDVVRLPKPQNLPVVFAARLSLSFPVLLSAVPLMTPDFARKNKDGTIPLRRVWFSDGGLTSNFPIHFFDSPIPSRPTFCLNLVDFDAECPKAQSAGTESEAPDDQPPAAAAADDKAKPIAQPRAVERTAAMRPDLPPDDGDPHPGDPVWGFISMAKGNRLAPIPFTAFDAPEAGVVSFLTTLLNTARFWSDYQMLVAPGVRDRVIHIALREDEGGLNLDMDEKVIADLDLRGRAAGLLISARFDPHCETDPETAEPNTKVFANHRWVRYRNFMAAFEDLSRRFAIARRKSDTAAKERKESLLDAMIAGQARETLGYPAPAAARDFYQTTTDELDQLALRMAAARRADLNSTFDQPRDPGVSFPRSAAAPRPKMRIRLRPLVDDDPRSEHADLPEP